MTIEEIRQRYNLSREESEKCYITVDNKVIPPRGGLTGEEVYKQWLENKDKIKEPTSQEVLNAQILKENAEQKLLNAQLLKEIADLKGGSANV